LNTHVVVTPFGMFKIGSVQTHFQCAATQISRIFNTSTHCHYFTQAILNPYT
jgi:hypothetical protein